MLKSLVLTLALVIGGLLIGGCTWNRLPGMVDSGQDRLARTSMIDDIQDRHIVDDWDYLWLYERNSRLSEWHAEARH